jgi:hypothetical protein
MDEIQVGSVVQLEPIFEDGRLVGFLVIDAESGEILDKIAKESVTVVPKENA